MNKKRKKSVHRHKPPSRIKYEHNNPVVSFRVKKAWYEEFKKLLMENDMSIGDFFRIGFKKQKANYNLSRRNGFNAGKKIGYNEGHSKGYPKGYPKGYSEGYDKGKTDWGIWYFCSICGEKIYVRPNSNSHKDIIEHMKEVGWGHKACREKKSSGTY